MVVYDITKRGTFENIEKWISEITQYGNDRIVMALVGNKCDAEDL